MRIIKKKGNKMSTFKKKNACAYEAVDAFGGIDRSALAGRLSEAWDINNFRVLADGSLQKREGYELCCTLSSPIDAVRPVPDDDSRLYVLSGGCVWCVSTQDSTYRLIGRAADVAGGCFLSLGGQLYVLAGSELSAVTECGLLPVEGYVPLYGSEWSEEGGEVCQPRNLLSDRVRLTYRLREPSVVLKTGLDGFSIEQLYVDGEQLDTAYAQGQFICLPGSFPEGTVIEACLVFDTECEDTEALLSSRGALELGDEHGSAVCCGEGDALFPSRAVTYRELLASQTYRPASMPIYFPESDIRRTGLASPMYMAGNASALVVSDRERSFLLTSEGELRPLPDLPGALCHGLCIGGDAYVASPRGLYRVSLTGGSCTRLIDSAEHPAPFGERTIMCYDPRYSELLIASATDPDGEVLVWSISGKRCYRFSGIGAQIWFCCGERPGFAAAGGIFVFDPERGCDRVSGGDELPIEAEFVSRWSDLGLSDRPWRLRSVRLCSCGSEPVTLALSSSIGCLTELTFPGGDGEALALHRHMLRCGRCEHVRLRLRSCGCGSQHLLGLALYAIK